jgi:cupin fold WbuC family metalloprotein
VDARELTPWVFAANGPVPAVTREDVAILKRRAELSPRRQSRLLLHRGADDQLHEMLIVHSKGRYIRPHRNDRSSKTYHVVEGSMECVLFEDDGAVASRYTMTDVSGGGVFMLRIGRPCYHTLIPLTETVAFVETILGPFLGTAYAAWAPPEGGDESRRYYQELCSTTRSDRR